MSALLRCTNPYGELTRFEASTPIQNMKQRHPGNLRVQPLSTFFSDGQKRLSVFKSLSKYQSKSIEMMIYFGIFFIHVCNGSATPVLFARWHSSFALTTVTSTLFIYEWREHQFNPVTLRSSTLFLFAVRKLLEAVIMALKQIIASARKRKELCTNW